MCPTRWSAIPGRLRQVLINLVGNAVKFTDAGDVVVEVAGEARDRRDAPRCEFTIADTGIGIAPDKQWADFRRVRAGRFVDDAPFWRHRARA